MMDMRMEPEDVAMVSDGAETAVVGDKAWARIKAIGLPPDPAMYELWFHYIAGTNPSLNEAVDALAETGALSPDCLQDIYKWHLSPNRYFQHLTAAGENLRSEIDVVAELIDVAYGSTLGYSEELQHASRRLDQAHNRQTVCSIVTALIQSTEKTKITNKLLQEQLNASEAQLMQLRDRIKVLHVESMTDPLTAIANRKLLEVSLTQMVEQADHTGCPLSLVFVDIDNFKDFNDRFGHRVGDSVLHLVALTIRNTVRGADLVARYGGDEFVILLPRTTRDEAVVVAEHVRQALAEKDLVRRSTKEPLGRISLSVGVAEHKKGEPPQAVIEKADRNLYAAKRKGRNLVMACNDGVFSRRESFAIDN